MLRPLRIAITPPVFYLVWFLRRLVSSFVVSALRRVFLGVSVPSLVSFGDPHLDLQRRLFAFVRR